MKPKPTTIDFAHAIAAFYRECDLGIAQIHVLTFIIARLARRQPCDTKTLMDLLPGEDRRLTSNIISILESKGYLKSAMVKQTGVHGQCRVMQATDKTKQFVEAIKHAEKTAMALLIHGR